MAVKSKKVPINPQQATLRQIL